MLTRNSQRSSSGKCGSQHANLPAESKPPANAASSKWPYVNLLSYRYGHACYEHWPLQGSRRDSYVRIFRKLCCSPGGTAAGLLLKASVAPAACLDKPGCDRRRSARFQKRSRDGSGSMIIAPPPYLSAPSSSVASRATGARLPGSVPTTK